MPFTFFKARHGIRIAIMDAIGKFNLLIPRACLENMGSNQLPISILQYGSPGSGEGR